MSDDSDSGDGRVIVEPLAGKLLPLNSRRLTAAHLRHIAGAMGLPSTGSADEVRQLIEGKLGDEREVRNVQVILEESSFLSVKLSLTDGEGVFLEADPLQKPLDASVDSAELERKLGEATAQNTNLTAELVKLQGALTAQEEETAQLQEELRTKSDSEEVKKLKNDLQKQKEKSKQQWQMSCHQAAEQEELLAEKDREIEELKKKLASSSRGSPTPPSHSDLDDDPPLVPPGDSHSLTAHEPPRRRGKAPPIDQYTGEDPEIRFEDWLPGLQRAARWNRWTDEETLMQLAGHLRGKALQEWNLLLESDKTTFEKAVVALREVLGPGSKVLAAQDFRHATQNEGEAVSAFIRRLERTFSIAYGADKLSPETRGAFLYGQLQEGLRHELMRSPSVSGALTYKELVMAAKNEEKRQSELKKRQQYLQPSKSQASGTAPAKKSTFAKSDHPKPQPSQDHISKIRCHNCRKIGHMKKDCPYKTESTGNKQHANKNPPSTSAKQVTADGAGQDVASDNPLDYLYSDSDEEKQAVKTVRVNDTGSIPQCAKVLVEGVPAYGIVDSAADITIMGSDLFKKVASVCRLKKRDFKSPDTTPRTYDQKPFTLHGRIDLDLTFGDTTMKTPIYVKMDAFDQLLLSEGVCRQLGIISYHPDVKRWNRSKLEPMPQSDDESGEKAVTEDSEVPEKENREVRVPAVHVKLLQSVSLLPKHETDVKVRLEGDYQPKTPVLVESNPELETVGLHLDDSFVCPDEDGITVLRLTNPSGFTCRLEEGATVGNAEHAMLSNGSEPDDETVEESLSKLRSSTTHSDVKRVESGAEWRKEKLRELYKDNIDLPHPVKDSFLQFLSNHHEAFSLEENERGETDLLEMEIDTGDAPPKKQRPRRMPFAVRQEVSKQLKRMQDAQVIQPSKSPWASPVVLVRKRDGTHRFCIDYRELNSVTKPDTYPLPRIEDLLDQLGESHYFSTLDLSSGFWQIRIHPDSVEKTAFTTPQGLFEFRVMPFGLTNAPGVFQRLMQQVLMGLNPEDGPDFVSVYIDDILVFSKTLEEHLLHLERVLKRIIDVGLKLKPAKCQFFRQEVEYLGHTITPLGLKTSNRHVTAVDQFPTPTHIREVRRFLGMVSYYRRFIPSFAKIAHPLHALTRKDAQFEWTHECQEAFETLKKQLISAPVLGYPRFDAPFVLETDASIDGLGAVLSQTQEDGKLHPIAYASRALTPGEKNYGITDLETLAVVWSLSHFQSYLYGQKVTVFTDHSAVRAVLQNPGASGKHARWWTKVYGSGIADLNIIYRPGKENTKADALSRSPQCPAPVFGEAETEIQVSAITGDTIDDMLQMESDTTLSNPHSFAREQRKDEKINQVILFLETEKLPSDDKQARKIALQSSNFTIEDGVLYFLDSKHNHRKRAVVPGHLRERVMTEVHGGPFSGHFSGNRLYNVLTRVWWWEGMYKDAVSHSKSCPDCAIAVGGGRPGRPPLQPIPVQRIFQIVGVDVMDLPRTERGNKHVLVFQDFLSKWPMVFPIPDQKTERIVKLLVEELVPFFGVPEALLSDRGTNLLSHLMKDICSMLGIEKLNTTAYHPQCDGLTERFNRTLKTMLRKHAAQYGAQWDTYLPGVLWAYRNTPHEATGEKPSFLLFGQDCRSPTEAALLPPSSLESMELTDYRRELIHSLSTARELAAKNIQQAQAKYKKQYDRKAKSLSYEVGDWVLIRFPQEESGANRKLSRPWHGPYRIESVSSTGVVAVKVYFPQEGSIQVHAQRVTKCPVNFPSGYYWYGNRRKGPGRPPKWLDQLMTSQTVDDVTSNADDAGTDTDANAELSNSTDNTSANGEEEVEESTPTPRTFTRTRTRTVIPPERLM